MPTLDVNGTTLYYEDTGPGSTGETIAFSHGLLWSTALFAPQIAALRDRYRCVAWDHRGQGRSAADHRHTIDMELVWQDATLLLERLAPGPVHFCGLSMGGFVAMRMAARRPDLVRSLILLETSCDPEPIENLARYRLLTRILRWVGPRPVRRQALPIFFAASSLRDPRTRDEIARWLDAVAARRDVWRAINGVIDRAGIHPELARISAPTLVVVGDEDVATPPPRAAQIAGAIANATLAHIARAGHSSTVEQPEAVTRVIEDFLTTLRPAP